MFFSELSIENVGVYRGRQTLDLRTEKTRPVILIGGMNGCGKTTLLDSLHMALYGRRARLSNRGNLGWEPFLRQSISRGVPASHGSKLALTFRIDHEGSEREYRVERSWRVRNSSLDETVNVFLDGKFNRALSEGWAEHVEEILPLEIASLFLFDGEKIESLADPDTAATVVRSAIDSLLGIGTIKQLRADLRALQRRQPSVASDSDSEATLQGLETERAVACDELDRLAQAEAAASNDVRAAQKLLSAAEGRFESDGGTLFLRRKELEDSQARLQREIASARQLLHETAAGIYPLVHLLDQLGELSAQAESDDGKRLSSRVARVLETRDREIVAKMPAEFKNLLAATLESDRRGRNVEADSIPITELSTSGRAQLATLESTLLAAETAANEKLASLESLKRELDEVDGQLGGVPDDATIAVRINEVNAAREVLARSQAKVHFIQEEHARGVVVLESVESRLAVAEAKRIELSVQAEDVQRIVAHTERVRQTLVTLAERLTERHLGRIEVATLDSLRRLMRKDSLVRDLKIEPTSGRIVLFDFEGEEMSSSRLSAGERQLLAVALLWGLARVAGHRLPTVIDTPLGRLDSQHRMNLVDRYFPVAGNQVLLLSTDQEIDEDLMRRLSGSISRSYLLSNDATTGSTTVKDGYWWDMEESNVA
ncbi:DNA sulfur modification protein DndD [Arthrobacter sp. PAMC25284]|uniref:DNA sulfur modification protein DndD n=1 Tax=Arthrobacter sp. PAMC25284 TaxID=2861279 RepID=UPI001C62819F|nr:DNA sulfur modification protein DndD [Arthrobacter sp. PAMC25284]QYF91074.1 DNA sulfur modification protein DndD [Arthrobacter sp. PAMC25284]